MKVRRNWKRIIFFGLICLFVLQSIKLFAQEIEDIEACPPGCIYKEYIGSCKVIAPGDLLLKVEFVPYFSLDARINDALMKKGYFSDSDISISPRVFDTTKLKEDDMVKCELLWPSPCCPMMVNLNFTDPVYHNSGEK
jgi:hypothetical protein